MTSSPLTIAILGAQSTGKTQLAAELSAHFENAKELRVLDAPDLHRVNTCDVILLMGLDLPTDDATLHKQQNLVDADLRGNLLALNHSFHVVYGTGQQRFRNALHSISQHAPALQNLRQEIAPRWTGPCETCGDGDCEHRLFTQLLK